MHSDEPRSEGSVALAWAKSPNRPGVVGSGWLSLVDHSIDVAAVAEALLRLPTIRRRLSALAARPLSEVDVARLCFAKPSRRRDGDRDSMIVLDHSKQPLCRLYFNAAQKKLGLIGAERAEERVGSSR